MQNLSFEQSFIRDQADYEQLTAQELYTELYNELFLVVELSDIATEILNRPELKVEYS
jgi:hypothetical protein